MNGKITLCEFARTQNNGQQFDALGAGINAFVVGQFPTPIAFSVLAEAMFTSAERDQNIEFEIKVTDEENRAAGPFLNGNIHIGHDHKGTYYTSFNIQLMAKHPVKLTLSLLLNKEEMNSVTLEIKRGKQNPLLRNVKKNKK